MSDNDEPWHWERDKNEQHEIQKKIDAKKDNFHRLDESIILRDPALNYGIWDKAEIEPLEDYLRQCFNMKEKHDGNPNFMQNWINCDRAIKYYNNNILTQYVNFDESVPLKEAIRTGCAIHNSSELTTEEIDLLIEMKKKGHFSIDGCDDDIRLKLEAGEKVRMNMKRYLIMKVNNDERVREAIKNNKHLLELYRE